MWQLKTLELLAEAQPADSIRLPQAMLRQHQQGLSLMAEARRQAEQIVQQAEIQAQQLIDQARYDAEQRVADLLANSQFEFLSRAETLFAGWQEQQIEQEAMIVGRASELLHQVMTRLLEDTGPAQQMNALLRQLLQAQPRGQQATLWSHPANKEHITQWLEARPHLTWERQFDESLEADQLLLETASGELRIGWQALKTQLLRASA
ncbi:MAG: type III secretion system stator protein SctL [Ewingella sp.]|nr:type III secretion system stator protein SctL [Ewingella sp.]